MIRNKVPHVSTIKLSKVFAGLLGFFILSACSEVHFYPISSSEKLSVPLSPEIGSVAAKDLTFITKKNITLTITKTAILAANTSMSDKALQLVSIGNPSLGSLSRAGDTYSFMSSQVGSAVFNYVIQDADGALATGRINIKVTDVDSVPGVFYAANPFGQLFVLDTAQKTLTASLTSTYQGQVVGFNDLAIDFNGVMFGKDTNDNVYIVDGSTGISSIYLSNIVPAGSDSFGLTILPNGNFVTVMRENNSGIYSVISVNPLTKAKTTLVSPAKGYRMAGGDIKLLPDGYLYWTVTKSSSELCKNAGGSGNQAVVKIDPSSGATTELVCLTVPDVFGLGFADGKLYGFSGVGNLVEVNLTSGAISVVNSTGVFFAGAAANPIYW